MALRLEDGRDVAPVDTALMVGESPHHRASVVRFPYADEGGHSAFRILPVARAAAPHSFQRAAFGVGLVSSAVLVFFGVILITDSFHIPSNLLYGFFLGL